MIDTLKCHYKNHHKQLSKFTIVGLANTVIDFALFFVFYNIFGFYYTLAHVGAFFIAWVNSFIFNAVWTFRNLKRDQLVKQVMSFFVVGIIGLGFSTLTIQFVGYGVSLYLENQSIAIYGAKILAMFVSFAWNYLGSALFVFKD